MAAALLNAGAAAIPVYIAAAFALAFRVEWLHGKGRAPNSPSMFGWFGLNLIRAIVLPTYLQIRDSWANALLWAARICGAVALAMVAFRLWADVRAGLF